MFNSIRELKSELLILAPRPCEKMKCRFFFNFFLILLFRILGIHMAVYSVSVKVRDSDSSICSERDSSCHNATHFQMKRLEQCIMKRFEQEHSICPVQKSKPCHRKYNT